MWEHRQPDISAFTALIKPIRNIVTGGGRLWGGVGWGGTASDDESVIPLYSAFPTAKRNSPVNNQCSPGSANPGPVVSEMLFEHVQPPPQDCGCSYSLAAATQER